MLAVLGAVGCSEWPAKPYGEPSAPQGTAGSSPLVGIQPPSGSAGSGSTIPVEQPFPMQVGQPGLQDALVTSERKLPSVSGGTLLVLANQTNAIVSDPDRDQVVLVGLTPPSVLSTLSLPEGAEPGRAIEDPSGHVHVVLRGSGQLLTLDPTSGAQLGLRSVCRYPRGVAVQNEVLHVACAEGRLVSLSTDPSVATPVRELTLDRDLRDVVPASSGLWVSRFRWAEVLRLDEAGQVVGRYKPPNVNRGAAFMSAAVAWRMVPGENGGVLVSHQRGVDQPIVPGPGGYASSGPTGVVESAISEISEEGVVTTSDSVIPNTLPVDVAHDETGQVLVASAATIHPSAPAFQRAPLFRYEDLHLTADPVGPQFLLQSELSLLSALPLGQMVAVGFAKDVPLMLFREPNQLLVGTTALELPGDSVADTGDRIFHLQTGAGLACASCHPEGQEDGRIWNFMGFGPRRTQSLRGGLLGTEPFHWDGFEKDFSALTADVMQGRMAGPMLTPEQTNALARYVDRFAAMPAPAAETTPELEKGQALFEDPEVGCATCHSGPRFTNNLTMDVGSGDGHLQVPSLIGLWARAPYLHDGCARILADRFVGCDTGKHGNITNLTPEDRVALTKYLETL
jgi:mono/diheme cytochrome c family protein